MVRSITLMRDWFSGLRGGSASADRRRRGESSLAVECLEGRVVLSTIGVHHAPLAKPRFAHASHAFVASLSAPKHIVPSSAGVGRRDPVEPGALDNPGAPGGSGGQTGKQDALELGGSEKPGSAGKAGDRGDR